jgi:hypothetical protein
LTVVLLCLVLIAPALRSSLLLVMILAVRGQNRVQRIFTHLHAGAGRWDAGRSGRVALELLAAS